MKVKIDLRLDIPGISKLKNRLVESKPELNDFLKKSVSEAIVQLIDQHNKPFAQLVQSKIQEGEAAGILKVKDEHRAGVYAIGNTFFNPEATVRYAAKKAAATVAVEGGAKAATVTKEAGKKAETKTEAAPAKEKAAEFEL